MAELVKAGYLKNSSGVESNATSLTGRFLVNLPHIPSVSMLFITFSSTGTLTVEVKDGKSASWIPVKTITANSIVKLALPTSGISINISANAGTITAHYRTVVVNQIPNLAIEVFSGGEIEPPDSTSTVTQIDTQKRLYGPAQPGAGAGTLYTVPTGKKATIETIHVANTTGTAATITLSIGADAAATRLLSAFSIPANGVLTLTGKWSLVAAEVVQGLQGTAAALTVTINGSETNA